jgi:hypothetical protein
LPNDTLSDKPAQQTVTVTWTNDSSMATGEMGGGYSGFLWKESYELTWDLKYIATDGVTQAVPYFYAGPGMIYIPATQDAKFTAVYNTDYGPYLGYLIVLPLVVLLLYADVELIRRWGLNPLA